MFWNSPVNFDDEDSKNHLVLDIAPFIVLEDTPLSKIHFLFIMLNITQVNIVKQGCITGIISKLEFLKRRKEEEKKLRKALRLKRMNQDRAILKLDENKQQLLQENKK